MVMFSFARVFGFSSRLLLVGAISGVSVQAADAEDKNLHLTRIENPPVIDGKLDEEIWKTAAVITDLRQIRPVDGAPVSARTEVYVAYDKDALYVAARLWDNPQEVTAKIMKQGSSLGEDDRIAVIIDPFNTGRNGYRFEVNANGVRNDMLYQNNRLQPEWTVIWDAAGAITDDGWIAEFAIPFKTLPLDPEINSWGFNVSRAIRRKGEEAVWVSRNRSWNPSIVGSIEGLRDLDQGIGLDIVPGLSLREHKDYEPEHKESDIEPSLDVYYRITPSLSGSLTFNTDFSATEVDERQVNLTRFNLFFPEKRDFFLNDADLFEFGRIGQAGYAENIRSVARTGQENARPFFSRRLGLSSLGTPVDIDYGGKLSGRIGNVTIGTLAIRQDDFVKPDGTVIPASDAFVSRMTADVLEESSIGLIGTSGDPTTGNDNSLVGADFLYLNTNLPGNRVLESEFWFQQTNTPGINGDDTALGVGLRSPNLAGWRGGAGYREIGENFNPALGFVSRKGVRDYVGELGYTQVIAGNFWQSVFSGVDANRITNRSDGELQTQIVALRPLELETRGRDILKVIYTLNDESVTRPFTLYKTPARIYSIQPGNYSFNDYGFDLESGKQRKYSGKFVVRTGDFYDGERLNLGSEFGWKQSRHLTLRLAYDWNAIDLPQGEFITRLARAAVEVGITSNLSWTSLFQYDNVSELFGIHSRLHWIPEAGQEVLLVFNHGSQDVDKDNSFASEDAEASLKLGYTFRL